MFWLMRTYQKSFKINVWAATLRNKLLSYTFHPDNRKSLNLTAVLTLRKNDT